MNNIEKIKIESLTECTVPYLEGFLSRFEYPWEMIGKIKELAARHGYCPDTKQYKKDPTGFKGHVGDVSAIIRLAVTGRESTPDMCAVMKILGKETVIKRLLAE